MNKVFLLNRYIQRNDESCGWSLCLRWYHGNKGFFNQKIVQAKKRIAFAFKYSNNKYSKYTLVTIPSSLLIDISLSSIILHIIWINHFYYHTLTALFSSLMQ